MDEGAARTSSAKEAIAASRTESFATDSQSQHQTQLQQQHLHHSPSHLSAAMCLGNFSEVLDPSFFNNNNNNNNNRTSARQKRQRTTAAEALLTAAEYDDDGACAQQKRAHNDADVDIVSMLGDPKGIAADGVGRGFEALDDVLLLSGNSWSDMVQEMESEKKSRAPRKG